jgi:hypothetical protein
MGLQKYRADEAGTPYPSGAIPWYTSWMGGPSLALIRECPTPFGPRTVYVRGEADTFFSLPSACRWKGRDVRGFLSLTDGEVTFTPYSNSWVYPRVLVES